jgi:peptide/nickel transport system permease protein
MMRMLRWLPFAFLAVVVACALFAPLLAPYPPTAGALGRRLMAPRWTWDWSGHPLGTDPLGRDVLSRLLYGARISLVVAVAAVCGAGAIGTAVGLVCGYFGGRLDAILSSMTEIALAIPLFLMSVILVAVLGPSLFNVIVVIIALLWPYYAKQVRAEARHLSSQDFVTLAKIANCGPIYIMRRHVLANIVPTLIVLATMQLGQVILLEAALSFIGVGIPPPTAAWGLMVGEGQRVLAIAWWVSFWPGLAISLTVLAANLAGDALRDWIDPRLRTDV